MARIALIIACLAGAGVVSATAGCDVFTPPAERVERAEQLIRAGAYGEALVQLNIALEKAPGDARAQLALAQVSLQLGNADAARRALDAAAEADADAMRVAELRARALMVEGRFEALLAATDSTDIAMPARGLLRLRALVALNRAVETVELAHSLPRDAATEPAIAVALAETYARLGNPSAGQVLLDAAVRAHPGAAEAWLARGRLQQIDGRVLDAELSLRTALENAAGNLTLMQQLNGAAALADLELARDDLEAARATHQRSVELAPDSAPTVMLGARVALAEDKANEATAVLQELLARHPELDETRILLVSALLAGGRLEQALQQAMTLRQANPNAANITVAADVLRRLGPLAQTSGEYWQSSAGVHVALGQPYMARQALRRALESSPDAPQVLAALAQLELRHGRIEEARRLAGKLAADRPSENVALSLLAEADRQQSRHAQAEARLQQLWARGPSAATALALARVRQEGKLGNVPAALEAWVADHPEDLKMRFAFSDALRQAGEHARAIVEYEALLAVAPNSVPALNNLAWLYYLEKDARALPTARRAWQLAPAIPNTADTYGWLLVESGAVREGLNVLEAAYRDGGLADPEIRYHYAAALARADQPQRAATLLAWLLAETPEFPARAAAQALAASLP